MSWSPRSGDSSMSLEDLARVRGLLTHAPVRMGLIVLTVALGFAAWNLSSQPVYRSAVKLRVDDVTTQRPQVEHRAIPTGTIDEGQALTMLRSRSLIAGIVAPPAAETTEGHPTGGLGLTTWITDENAPPLRRILRGAIAEIYPDFRLEAEATRLDDHAPTAVRIRFVSPNEVNVSNINTKPGVEWPQDEAETFTFEHGVPIDYHGLSLQLRTAGRVDGRVWRVESLTEDQAIDRVLRGLRIDKQQHQAGTLALTVHDDDPVRAAAIANAVAAAFVHTDHEAARKDALETARFLQVELKARRLRLDALTAEVAKLQGNNPDTLNPDATALVLGDRAGAWDDIYRKARNRRILAKRVELMIASGQPLRTALSAVGGDHSPEIEALVKALDVEEAELRQIFRGSSDAAGYRQTLLLKADDYRIDAERFRGDVIDLRDIIGRLEAGDLTALSRLGGDLAREGSISVDLNMRTWLVELERARLEYMKLSSEFKEQYPPVRVAKNRMNYYTEQITAGLSAVLVGFEATLAQKIEYSEAWSALHSAFPESEAKLIRASIAQIETEIAAAYSAHTRSLEIAEEAAEGEVTRLRERLKDLALGKQELLGIQLQTRELDQVVGELVRDVENAHVAVAGIMPSARIIDTAIVSKNPLKPNAAFGLIAGLVLGLLAALTWAWFDLQRKPVRAQANFGADERLSALPICGRVAVTGPATGEARQFRLLRGYDGPAPSWLPMMEDPESPAAQTYRTLRARLKYLVAPSGEAPKVIGLTSAQGAGGTATVAINLAMARAQLGERVLLIDADLKHPTLRSTVASTGLESGTVFGSDVEGALGTRTRGDRNTAARGLGECLDGSAHWSDVAIPSGFPKLDVLYTGRSDVIAADLMASQMFDVLCDEVRSVYDLVLVGMPPVNETPEAEAAAGAMDGWLFTMSEVDPVGSTIVDDCVQRLQHAGGHILGLVKTIAIERRQSSGTSGLQSNRRRVA